MKLLKIHRPESYALEDYMQDFRDEMEQLFRRSYEPFGNGEGEGVIEKGEHKPPVELCEKNGRFELKAQLPGIKKEDISIEVSEDSIKIKAETREEKKEESENVYRSEFRYGKFVRKISLPEKVMSSDAEAEFKNGVLRISIPKAKKEEKEVKKITVK